MKKSVTWVLAACLLFVGLIFGAAVPQILSSTPVYADEDPFIDREHNPDDDNPGNEETPGDDTPSDDDDPFDDREHNPDDPGGDDDDPFDDREHDPDHPSGGDDDDPFVDREHDPDSEEAENVCKDETQSLSWILCPSSTTGGSLVDNIYEKIEDILQIDPVTAADDSPIYITWKYVRDLTNIVFIIFVLVVIYSQLTGFGISNYGIKRTLPRIIIAAVLVNLSFLICSLAVDVSNIVGSSLSTFFDGIRDTIVASAGDLSGALNNINWGSMIGYLTGTVGLSALGLTAVTAATSGLGAIFWMIVIALIGAVISVVVGVITISLRQGVIAVLIMIAPLAFVAYLLPNTEKWFERWKSILVQMLVFYPMFSFLFSASRLIGWTFILTAIKQDPVDLFWVVIGLIVQVLPLFLSITLMKMSGSVLGKVSGMLDRLTNPARKTVEAWGQSHAEQHRQNYLRRNVMPGAKLRNYLAYRQSLRELDTENAQKVVAGRAKSRAFDKASSYRGRDLDGNDVWYKHANRYTRTAKQAGLLETRANTALSAYKNTLSAYGGHFGEGRSLRSRAAARLSAASTEAYKESMKQEFLTINEAQADQEMLLNEYIKASNNQYRNPYEYNRLIKGAAGSLRHNGESSIMGQVIAKSVEIENRRRREAAVIMTKFGVDKPTSRGMIFDCAHISDDGYETDENGHAIEDEHFRLLPGKHHQEWGQYIAVHKTSGKELTSSEYVQLSEAERENYNKVRYFDIYDDKHNPVQRVYSDDAGYMKELLRNDFSIGDPINRRYLGSIGLGLTEEQKSKIQQRFQLSDDEMSQLAGDGSLRKYASTITGIALESKYKEHWAPVTPMLTAQTRMGYVLTPGQQIIAELESLTKASKAGAFLQNDGPLIDILRHVFESFYSSDDGMRFEDYFQKLDIATYRNVNGLGLHGFRMALDNDGNVTWKKIDRNDSSLTLDECKNFLAHYILPKAAIKSIGMMNRNISQGLLENQKPDTLQALLRLCDSLEEIGIKNVDKDIPFADRLNAELDLYEGEDPSAVKAMITHAREAIRAKIREQSGDGPDDPGTGGGSDGGSGGTGGSGGSGGSGGGSGRPRGGNGGGNGGSGAVTYTADQVQALLATLMNGGQNPHHQGLDGVRSALLRGLQNRQVSGPANARDAIRAAALDVNISTEQLCDAISDIIDGDQSLGDDRYEIEDILDAFRRSADSRPHSSAEAAHDIAMTSREAQERCDALIDALDPYFHSWGL